MKRKNKKFLLILKIVIWTAFCLVFGLGYYVNHYLPHGSMYPTGEYVCMNDDRGPCEEAYEEDLSGLSIPEWAKFLRGNGGFLLLFGLGIAGLIITAKTQDKLD